MPDAFGPDTMVVEVVSRLGDRGRDLLRRHGYEVGEGFVDVLSQYQSLRRAYETERLRDLKGLLTELNSSQ